MALIRIGLVLLSSRKGCHGGLGHIGTADEKRLDSSSWVQSGCHSDAAEHPKPAGGGPNNYEIDPIRSHYASWGSALSDSPQPAMHLFSNFASLYNRVSRDFSLGCTSIVLP